jgi:hypothetical protein
MTEYDEILQTCATTKPDLIYLAVGCSQKHHTRAQSTPQEYPPFVSDWPGTKVCILIDPELESPPYCFQELGFEEPANMKNEQIQFFLLRRSFDYPRPAHWSPAPPNMESDMAFLNALCTIACQSPNTKLIFQDYSGRDISDIYPIHIPQVQAKVLFDVTYNDGGCFIDLNSVNILKETNGDFFQPKYSLIKFLRNRSAKRILEIELKERSSVLADYVHRYYCILKGMKEDREWCSPEVIRSRMDRLCKIYKTPQAVDGKSIVQLMLAGLFDFCARADQYMSEEEALAIINHPDQYTETMKLLRDAILNE